MKVVGRMSKGTVATDCSADRKVVERWTMPACRVVKLSAYVDGLGSGGGDQVARPVIYTAAGALVALGDPITVVHGKAPGWVDYTFTTFKGGVVLAAGDYDLGFIRGGVSNSMRAYGDPVGGATQRRTNVDTYADGASDPFGAPDATDNQLFSWFATYVSAWTPKTSDLFDLAQLPLDDAQAALAALASASPAGRQAATSGWHGTSLDDGMASFVLVDREGPLADLVGRVVKISLDQAITARQVWAFCHASADLDPGDDLSLPRPLFLALGPLAVDGLPVTVEVVS